MSQITVRTCEIEGLRIVEPTVHRDARGFFVEFYNEKDFREAGITARFVQDNVSSSVKGVLRGLHFQKHFPQAKLVRAGRGTVFDVAVDLRKDSKTFGKWHGEILSDSNFRQMYIPEGFAHGYLVLSDEAEFCYKVNDFYHPGDEGGIAFNDPAIGVAWPELQGEYPGAPLAAAYRMSDGTPLLLSAKDEKHPPLAECWLFDGTEEKEKQPEETVYLAGGCFWGVQRYFDQFDGVLETQVGYANGPAAAPSYQEVCASVGHAETLRIDFDPEKLPFAQLLDRYFQIIDPLSVNRQGHDTGLQYRTGIYYTNETQRAAALGYAAALERQLGEKLAVEILPLQNFFPAEEYHQKYLEKNPGGYCHIPAGFFS